MCCAVHHLIIRTCEMCFPLVSGSEVTVIDFHPGNIGLIPAAQSLSIESYLSFDSCLRLWEKVITSLELFCAVLWYFAPARSKCLSAFVLQLVRQMQTNICNTCKLQVLQNSGDLSRNLWKLAGFNVLRLEMCHSSNSNSTMFELWTFSADLKFDECFKRFVIECEFVEKCLFYVWFHKHREQESADKPMFFSN